MIEKHEENLQRMNNQLQPIAAALPPSASSSPSHEFSFISLHPPAPAKVLEKNKNPSSLAIDLSPADDIFFHGHLLPLHLVSHLPVSPRSSINSLDSFTLPIKELESIQTIYSTDINIDHTVDAKGRSKSKSFSLFSLSKWRKEEKSDRERQKKKLKFDISQVLKRYARMVRPLLSFKRGNKFPRQSYSFSGNLRVRGKPELRGRRGEFSAPASMKASPTNSGRLVANGTLTPTSVSDSTMEELQSAIQAAIAHCKKSIAMDEKIKSLE
ncbi:BRI1 kinase inhibitor 1-like [Olea europaea var. sylvestris]|uniref:BRI1 kinase inhibitor 1-like n=1 Tax=Olea europaea var. sylvestris TaxID=158386 RepID=UPI000C1D3418|nr:BRI1 kinase inhibitor 1-like [Olea europaea var. sylvestris]